MGYQSFIAYKHMTRRRKTGFISLISMISIAGVAVGVMALIVVLAVMSGFDRDFKAKVVNVQPHLRVERIGGITDPNKDIATIQSMPLEGLRSVSSFVEGQAIIRSQSNATGIVVKGVDTVNEDLSIYQDHLRAGELDFSDLSVMMAEEKKFLFMKRKGDPEAKVIGSIILGESLAARLRIVVGDRVNLIAPFNDPEKGMTLGDAEVKTFLVRGVFRVGMNDFDSTLALISLEKAQQLYHLNERVSGISVRFDDVDQSQVWKDELLLDLPSTYYVHTWYDLNQSFFQALKVEKSVMTILLALIILVATFNIVSTLTMVVMEKTKDIGILRALGATKQSIRNIFVMEGFSVGIFGVITGAALGLALAFHLNEVADFLKKTTGLEVFPSDIYYLDKIPAQVIPSDVLLTVGFAVVASIFAGLYPAQRAASLNPIEALRYE